MGTTSSGIPTASAVSINIFEPKAYASPPLSQLPNNQIPTSQIYNYPVNQIYDYNNPSQYTPQLLSFHPGTAQPMYGIIEPSQYGQNISPQQMNQYNPNTFSAQGQMGMPQNQNFLNQQQIVPSAGFTQVNSMPQINPPPPSIDQQQNIQTAPHQQDSVQQPAQQQANEQQSNIDTQAINANLRSPNPDEQRSAINEIVNLYNSGQPMMPLVANKEIFEGLIDIVTKNTTKLRGPEREKADLSKQEGLGTLAILQNELRQAIETNNGTKMPIQQLQPAIGPILFVLKQDPNPAIRGTGIMALKYLARPEDYQTVAGVMNIAMKHDPDPNVRASARQVLESILTPQQGYNPS
ncbi:MAG: hypothetical protein V2B14_04770 [bacterium]